MAGIWDKIKDLSNKLDRDKSKPGFQITRPKYYSPMPTAKTNTAATAKWTPLRNVQNKLQQAQLARINYQREQQSGEVGRRLMSNPATYIGAAGTQALVRNIGQGLRSTARLIPGGQKARPEDLYHAGTLAGMAVTRPTQYLVGGAINTGITAATNALQGRPALQNYGETFAQGMARAPFYAGLSRINPLSKLGPVTEGKLLERLPKNITQGVLREGLVEGAIEGAIRPLEPGETRGQAIVREIGFGSLFGGSMEALGDVGRSLKGTDFGKKAVEFLTKTIGLSNKEANSQPIVVKYDPSINRFRNFVNGRVYSKFNVERQGNRFVVKTDIKGAPKTMTFIQDPNDPGKLIRDPAELNDWLEKNTPIKKIGLQAEPKGGTEAILKADQAKLKGIETPTLKPQEQLMLPARSIETPEARLKTSLEEAKPQRALQEKLYTQERARRAGMFEQTQGGGEAGAKARLKTLGGELPKAEFEPIRQKFHQQDIDDLYNRIDDSQLSAFERATAYNSLNKLMGEQGTALPTKSELRVLTKVYGEDFAKSVQGKAPKLEKISKAISDVLAVPRSIMAGGFDMSFGLRQGIFSGYKYPKQYAESFKEQFKWFKSEDAIKKTINDIKSSPNYDLMKQNKLALTDMGDLTSREEQYFSNLAEKIPGLGKLIRASGRAYTGFANKYRSDIFNEFVRVGKETGALENPDYLKSAANFINNATGRGDLGNLNKSVDNLSTALFSPRLLASRLNAVNPVYYAKMQPQVRKEALKTLVSFAAGTTSVLALLDTIPGVDVGKDPRSSDFGKAKIGNTRVDIMGGQQQILVALARILSNEMVSSTTGNIMVLGEGYKPTTRADVIGRFISSKESPVFSFFHSMLRGEDVVGEKFELGPELVKRLTPMLAQDMYDLYQDSGFRNMAMAIPAFFGAGVQTYGGVPKVESSEDFMKLSTNELYRYFEDLRENDPQKFQSVKGWLKQESPNKYANVRELYTLKAKQATPREIAIKGFSVADGTRAEAIAKQFKKAKTPEDKAKLWKRYVDLKIITKDVAKQLTRMYEEGKL